MFTLYKKELSYYLNNPIGYIIIVIFAIFANFMFVKDLFLSGSGSMRPFFGFLPWLLMIFIPAISMRSISEEKRNNTIETLLTLPISEIQIVLAKFLALLTLTVIGLMLTLGLPITLYILTNTEFGRLYIPEVVSGYIGLVLLSASFISISMFFSSQTKNQVIALIMSVLSLFFLIVLSSDFLTFLPRIVQDALVAISPLLHLQNFTKGVIDVRSLFYFLSCTGVFLFLTVIDLEKRD